ncbi:MAG: hypothetical protein MHPSP_002931, partial [Paramarteilia canceri]
LIAVKYDSGVVLAGDCQGTVNHYRYIHSLDRFFKLNSNCAITASGLLGDLQQKVKNLELKIEREDFYCEKDRLDAPALTNLIRHSVYEK